MVIACDERNSATGSLEAPKCCAVTALLVIRNVVIPRGQLVVAVRDVVEPAGEVGQAHRLHCSCKGSTHFCESFLTLFTSVLTGWAVISSG